MQVLFRLIQLEINRAEQFGFGLEEVLDLAAKQGWPLLQQFEGAACVHSLPVDPLKKESMQRINK